MPWINHLPPVCWSTFGILVWNDSGYVNLTQWWYFFIIFEYILHISTPHIMVFCFPLPYFPLSTSALFFAKYSCTHIVYRRSLVTFYYTRNIGFDNLSLSYSQLIHIRTRRCLITVADTFAESKCRGYIYWHAHARQIMKHRKTMIHNTRWKFKRKYLTCSKCSSSI